MAMPIVPAVPNNRPTPETVNSAAGSEAEYAVAGHGHEARTIRPAVAPMFSLDYYSQTPTTSAYPSPIIPSVQSPPFFQQGPPILTSAVDLTDIEKQMYILGETLAAASISMSANSSMGTNGKVRAVSGSPGKSSVSSPGSVSAAVMVGTPAGAAATDSWLSKTTGIPSLPTLFDSVMADSMSLEEQRHDDELLAKIKEFLAANDDGRPMELPALTRTLTLHGTILPEAEVLNYLMKTYLEQVYPTTPVSIKPQLIEELQAGVLPDYFLLSIYFWVTRWDPALVDLIGPVRRAVLMKELFERLTTSLLPALEIALTGYDIMVSPELPVDFTETVQRDRFDYIRTAVFAQMSLFHLLGVAAAYPRNPNDPAGTFANFTVIQALMLQIFNVSRMLDWKRYGRKIPALIAPGSPVAGVLHNRPYFSVWLERAKRAWWGLVNFDNVNAVMYSVDPVISWEDCRKVLAVMTDEEFMAARKIADEASAASASPSYSAAGGDMGQQSPIISAQLYSLAGSSTMSAKQQQEQLRQEPDIPHQADGDGFGDPPPPDVVLDFGRDILLTAPLRSVYRKNGVRVSASFFIRLMQIGALVSKYRRLVPDCPYLDRPGKLHLEAQLDHWMSEMPPPFPNGILPLVTASKEVLASARGISIGALAYFKLMYHAIGVLLLSPSDDILYAGQLDLEWVKSSAFLPAQDHAIAATELLKPIVEASRTMPQLSLPFAQWCVTRTGLIHHVFLRSLAGTAGSMEVPGVSDAVKTAQGQLLVHASALRRAQGGVGLGDRKSWWYEIWTLATGLQ